MWVAQLLAAGVDVNVKDSYSGQSALLKAAENGHAVIVARLLAAGADAHAIEDEQLRWVAERGNPAIIEMVLAARADAVAT